VVERLAERLWGHFEDFRGVVGVGEHPMLALDRAEHAGRREGLHCSRSDDVAIAEIPVRLGEELEPGDKTLTGVAVDVLYVHATRKNIGTRVDLFGHSPPDLIHAVLSTLAEAPPWMRGPVWD